MKTRRVFIVWSHPLFHESVCLLLNHPNVEVAGARSGYSAAQAEIADLQPDTIIVEEAEDADVTWTEALQILETSSWSPRVIRLSLQDNELCVYSRDQWTVGQAGDLLRLILS